MYKKYKYKKAQPVKLFLQHFLRWGCKQTEQWLVDQTELTSDQTKFVIWKVWLFGFLFDHHLHYSLIEQ